MSQNLFMRFPIEVILALVATTLILLAMARMLIALRKPAPVRLPGEARAAPHAGREPAER
jgi:hypothetical protein